MMVVLKSHPDWDGVEVSNLAEIRPIAVNTEKTACNYSNGPKQAAARLSEIL